MRGANIFIEKQFEIGDRSHKLFDFLKTSKARVEEMPLLMIVVAHASFLFRVFKVFRFALIGLRFRRGRDRFLMRLISMCNSPIFVELT